MHARKRSQAAISSAPAVTSRPGAVAALRSFGKAWGLREDRVATIGRSP
ncbi:MAG TPA: hypothetical protein VGR26_10120 [Acidimicrobiales bacterium]|nr:hypothetical protein [Acidimicrobiales bacterium]